MSKYYAQAHLSFLLFELLFEELLTKTRKYFRTGKLEKSNRDLTE